MSCRGNFLSPPHGYQEVLDKVAAYIKSGVKTCWAINPAFRSITLYSADGAQKTCIEGQAVDSAIGITADLGTVFS